MTLFVWHDMPVECSGDPFGGRQHCKDVLLVFQRKVKFMFKFFRTTSFKKWPLTWPPGVHLGETPAH